MEKTGFVLWNGKDDNDWNDCYVFPTKEMAERYAKLVGREDLPVKKIECHQPIEWYTQGHAKAIGLHMATRLMTIHTNPNDAEPSDGWIVE